VLQRKSFSFSKVERADGFERLLRSNRIRTLLNRPSGKRRSVQRCGFENADGYLDRIEFFVPKGL
jgi:hypothetical protein